MYILKSIIWVITPCSPLSVNRRFAKNIASIFRAKEISSARNQQASSWQAEPCLAEDGGEMFLRNVD
jgi:hypothetical protein